MEIEIGNRKIVLFSGGFDSTLVLARLVKEAAANTSICAVTIDHNLTGTQKLRREYESQLLILRELRKQYPRIKIDHEVIHIESNWVSGNTYNSKGLAQPILWLCNIIPLLEDKDTIYLGYNKDDQAIFHETDIKNLISAACQIQEGKIINSRWPLKYFSKTEVLKALIEEFPYLVDFCTSCEAIRYEGEKVCGECLPCTHLKEALFNLTLNNNEVGERAKEMLKSRFSIRVSVAYETEEENIIKKEPAEEYIKAED